MLARKSRLQAERDGLDAITFDPELTSRAATSPEIATLIAAQEQQFAARRKSRKQEESQLEEQQTQIGNQNEGLVALQAATKSQIDAPQPRDRRAADAARPGADRGDAGADAAARAGAARGRGRARSRPRSPRTAARSPRSRSSGCGSSPRRARTPSPSCASSSSRRSRPREKRRQLLDRMARLYLRAPVSGTVYGSTADTVRAVIRPAEPVMYIVPQGHAADRAHPDRHHPHRPGARGPGGDPALLRLRPAHHAGADAGTSPTSRPTPTPTSGPASATTRPTSSSTTRRRTSSTT